jgi:hypothetical protein
MKKTLRFFSLVFTLLLLGSILASCLDEKEEAPGETSSDSQTILGDMGTTVPPDEEDIIVSRADYDDGIGENRYDGEKFRIFAQERFSGYAFSEGIVGDVIKDAIYERNLKVEERFGIDLVFILGAEEKMCNDFRTVVLAGSDEYDLFMGHQLYSAKIFTSGVFADWNQTGIDFSKPWFPAFVTDSVTINNRIYLTISDICLSTAARSTCIFYNMDIASQYNIENPYALVESGGWTLDKLTELAKDVYLDLDSDGTRSAADLYGASADATNNYVAGYIYSLQMDNVIIGADGRVLSNFGSERNLGIIEKLCYLFQDTAGGYMKDNFADNVARFTNGKVLFQHGVLEWGDTYYRTGCEFDYGILPYPKYDTAQKSYYSFPGGATSIIGLPITATRNELVRDVVTVMSAETWKVALPLYTEQSLKYKIARDEQSVTTIGLVLDGRVFDFAGMYDGFQGYTYSLYKMMQNRGNLASYIKTMDKIICKYYEKVAEMFYKN